MTPICVMGLAIAGTGIGSLMMIVGAYIIIWAENNRLTKKDIAAEWRPINIQPMDGSLVLFYAPLGQFIAPSLPPTKVPSPVNAKVYLETGEWPNAGYAPTHWMPLPPPPTET